MIFLFVCSLLSLFLCMVSSNVLKMLIFFLGSIFCFVSFLDLWVSYFFLMIYVGGLFILLLYISTFSFLESHTMYLYSSLIFFFYFFSFFRISSCPLFFVFFVEKSFFFFVLLILTLISLGLVFISFFLPSGICSKSNF